METRICESDAIRRTDSGPVVHFVFGQRDAADRFEQPPVVEPVDPVQGGELGNLARDRLHRRPSAGVLLGVIDDHPDRPLTNFLEKPCPFVVSGKPGAATNNLWPFMGLMAIVYLLMVF